MAGVIVLGFAIISLRVRVAGQAQSYFADSNLFVEMARQSASFEHLFYPKPVFVSLIYRAVDPHDVDAIAAFQIALSAIAWCLLGTTIVLAARRFRTRVAAAVVCVGFLLSPYRVGFGGAILSESINDSLTAIMIALGVALSMFARMPLGRRRTIACGAVACTLALTTLAWEFTRDTNPLVAIVAVGLVAWIWRIDRCRRRDRWALALVAVVLLGAVVSMWTASRPPSPSAPRLPYTAHWPEVMPRGAYPMINNVLSRGLPTADGRAFFVDRGMPQLDELVARTGDDDVFMGARFAPFRAWVIEHGRSVYLRWLLRHPLRRADELAGSLWDVLAPAFDHYMPPGWVARPSGIGWLLTVFIDSQLVVLALLLLAPLCLRRPRATPLTGIALVLIASGVIGVAASYYGDTLEIGRHCYGSAQQIVFGLYLAALARLDQLQAPTENAV